MARLLIERSNRVSSPARALPKAAMARVPTPTEPSSLPQAPPLGPRTLLTAEFEMGAIVQVVLVT
jgi:hypothetical protein